MAGSSHVRRRSIVRNGVFASRHRALYTASSHARSSHELCAAQLDDALAAQTLLSALHRGSVGSRGVELKATCFNELTFEESACGTSSMQVERDCMLTTPSHDREIMRSRSDFRVHAPKMGSMESASALWNTQRLITWRHRPLRGD